MPMSTPPPSAAYIRWPSSTSRATLHAGAQAAREPRRTEAAEGDADKLEHEPVAQRDADSLRQVRRDGRQCRCACRADHRRSSGRHDARERAGRAQAVADDDVRGEQHHAKSDACEIRIVVRRSFLDRSAIVEHPVLKRTVVEHDRIPEQARGKDDGGRLLADVAVGDDRVALLDAGCLEQRRDVVAVDQSGCCR